MCQAQVAAPCWAEAARQGMWVRPDLGPDRCQDVWSTEWPLEGDCVAVAVAFHFGVREGEAGPRLPGWCLLSCAPHPPQPPEQGSEALGQRPELQPREAPSKLGFRSE